MPGPPLCTQPSVRQCRAGDPSAADCAQQSGGQLRAAAIVTAPVRFACLYTRLSRNTALPCLLSPPPTTFSLFILAYMCCLSYEGSLHPSLPCQTTDPVCSYEGSLHPSLLARPLILSVPSLPPPPPPHLSLSFLPIFPLPPFPFKFASGELAKCRSLQEMWVLNDVWDGQWHRE